MTAMEQMTVIAIGQGRRSLTHSAMGTIGAIIKEHGNLKRMEEIEEVVDAYYAVWFDESLPWNAEKPPADTEGPKEIIQPDSTITIDDLEGAIIPTWEPEEIIRQEGHHA